MSSIKFCSMAVILATFAFLSCALAKSAGGGQKQQQMIVVPEFENNNEEQEPMVVEVAEFAGKHYRPGQLAQILSGGKSERPSAAGNLQFLVDGPIQRMEKKWSRFEPSIRFY